MKKIIFVIAMCLLFNIGVIAENLHREYIAKENGYIIEIDGKTHDFTLPVVTIDDNTYISLRQLCEKLGYKVNWVGEEEKIELSFNKELPLPFYNDINQTQEGMLSDGIKFNYNAKADFSYQNQINQWGLTSVESSYGEVPTAKMAAEIGRVILGYDKNNSDIEIQVYFDKDKDAWFVYGLVKGTSHSGLRSVAIQRADGRILNKYELR